MVDPQLAARPARKVGAALTRAEVSAVLAAVAYKGWSFNLLEEAGRLYLRVSFVARDCRVSLETEQKGRKWVLSPHMTRSEVVMTAFKAVLTAEEHEAREAFTYRGAAVFGPHLDVDALVDVVKGERFDARAATG